MSYSDELVTVQLNATPLGLSQPSDSPRLVTVCEGEPKSYEIGREAIIGRSSSAHVHLPHIGVSRRHARLVCDDEGRYFVEDLGSRNGTYVNGERVTRRLLGFGDEIRIGNRIDLLFTRASAVEDKLAEIQKMEAIGRLAAGVSHEFNNFLAVILSSLEFLAAHSDDADPDVAECIDDAMSAANQAKLVTRQLLGFSRQTGSTVERLDLGSVLREVIQLIRRTFNRSIDVVVDLPEGLSVRGEPGVLFQSFMNLCLNARDAMPRGGRLTVRGRLESAGPAPASVVIEVEDTGEGIDRAVLPHVFEPFYSTKTGGKGTGLGLAMVYGTVRAHGGHIEVESEQGRGTRFIVHLPASSSRSPRAVPGGVVQVADLSVNERARVLLVDDEPLVRRSVRRILVSAGHEVMTASNGKEAVELYEKHGTQIGLVLLDLNMPVMGGAEAFERLREMNPDVRVVVVSGYANQDREAMVRRGVVAVLDKPVTERGLLEALRTARVSGPHEGGSGAFQIA